MNRTCNKCWEYLDIEYGEDVKAKHKLCKSCFLKKYLKIKVNLSYPHIS